MSTPLPIAIVTDRFELGTPAQQLLDRFLIGYPLNGEFRQGWPGVGLVCASPSPLIAPRQRDFGLRHYPSLDEALGAVAGVLLAWSSPAPNAQTFDHILSKARPTTRVFVHGALASTRARAGALLQTAGKRGIELSSGASLAVATQLPAGRFLGRVQARESLVVNPVASIDSEVQALDGLLALLDLKSSPPLTIIEMQTFQGEKFWAAEQSQQWSRELLAASLSRSNTTQSGAVLDGRTEDIYGLGLLPKLVKSPRASVMKLSDGTKCSVVTLEGAIKDTNVAVRTKSGAIHSTQLYRPPGPNREEFSLLAGSIGSFLRDGAGHKFQEASLLLADFLERRGTRV